jgi:hypothetical protein
LQNAITVENTVKINIDTMEVDKKENEIVKNLN